MKKHTLPLSSLDVMSVLHNPIQPMSTHIKYTTEQLKLMRKRLRKHKREVYKMWSYINQEIGRTENE